MTLFLEMFDLFRFMAGSIAATLLLTVGTAKKRPGFLSRSVGGAITCIAISMLYVDIKYILAAGVNIWISSVITTAWWMFLSILTVLYIHYIYQISWGSAWFRGILGLTLQQMVTLLIRYLFVMLLFPHFPENHPFFYVIGVILVYVLLYTACYKVFAVKLQSGDMDTIGNTRHSVLVYVFVFVTFSFMTDLSGGIFEWILEPFSQYPDLMWVTTLVRVFCVGIMFLACVVVFVILYNTYEICALQQETQYLKRLHCEKEKQYESSKDNIALINQKCHDLKHQILALGVADDEERAKMVEETKRAVLFYDAVIQTDNEVLNTILTEKSLYCMEHNIKLTCMVHTKHLERMGVVDLYTILGNIIDNAIECVSKFKKNDKKTVSLSIQDKGGMLLIATENYFEEEIQMRHNLPITTKQDKELHGLGLKGVQLLVRKYGGEIAITTENHIFSLQIVIPVSKMKK